MPAPDPTAFAALTTAELYARVDSARHPPLRRALLAVPPFRRARPTAWFKNWAETFRCAPAAVYVPESEAQCAVVLELAKREGKSVRATGARHSPSDLWCTSGWMVDMRKMDRVLEVDAEKKTVTAEGGITLHALNRALASHGLAMRNLGSISDQSLAGIITTATHGTGWAYPVLSGDVRALTLLLASGQVVTCSRAERGELFLASLCGLGATGLILRATVQVEDAFRLKEQRERRPFADVIADLDTLSRASEHTRVWWNPQADKAMVMLANRTLEPANPPKPSYLWGTLVGHYLVEFLLFAGRFLPSIIQPVGRLVSWLDKDGPAAVVDESYNIFNLDCFLKQYTTEWALPYTSAQACLTELRAFILAQHAAPRGLRPHFPIEVRFTQADDIWLSPSFGRQTCWVGIVQYKPYGLDVPWKTWFAAFEHIMLAHGGRPHWAKLHPLTPADLRGMYPKFDDFVRVLADVDPAGVWRNEYVRRHVFGEAGMGAEVFQRREPH